MKYRLFRKNNNQINADLVINLEEQSGISVEELLRETIDGIQEKYSSTDKSIVIVLPHKEETGVYSKADLARYIDNNFRGFPLPMASVSAKPQRKRTTKAPLISSILGKKSDKPRAFKEANINADMKADMKADIEASEPVLMSMALEADECMDFEEEHFEKLEERMKHMTDTYSEYLLYLIQSKGMENAEVWKRAIIDKKIFSKIKNNPDYHPQKMTALCLCIGAKLNLDESRDLLARAGYALSPCDKTDIIFSYFIENEIYDMIELDIQLEEHGLPCIIA